MAVISRNKPLPLYIQLKEVILEKIENAEWKPGDKLPTEMELQGSFDVSRITVRQALKDLVSEGVLERVQGKGTYVADFKLEPIRPDVTGFTQDMTAKGHKVHSIVLEEGVVESTEKLQRIFSIGPDQNMYKLIRLRLVDDVVIGYHEAFINMSIAPFVNLERYDFEKDSLYISLEKEGITWGEANETVEAERAGEAYAEKLDISPDLPILKLARTTELEDGRVYEYTRMVYRSDKYKYSIKLR